MGGRCDELLTIGEASRMMGVCHETLRQWCRRGLLQALRDGRGWRHFRRRDLERVRNSWLQPTSNRGAVRGNERAAAKPAACPAAVDEFGKSKLERPGA